MGHRRSFALAAAVLLLTGAGCGTAGDGERTDPSTPASIDAALLECGDVAYEDPTLQLADVDLTAATWPMPDGFVETLRYSEDHPVEHVDSFWAAEPGEDPVPLNVLAVVVYTDLDWGEDVDPCGRVPLDAVDDRLVSYNEVTGAEPLTDVEEVDVAGLPALTEDLSLPEYTYRGYWVFSRSQLIHLYCQWTSDEEKDEVLTACDELVASVEVPGA